MSLSKRPNSGNSKMVLHPDKFQDATASFLVSVLKNSGISFCDLILCLRLDSSVLPSGNPAISIDALVHAGKSVTLVPTALSN